MKLTCFTFLSYREHLNLPTRGILINFRIQAKFIWILEIKYLNWIEYNSTEKKRVHCALWAESGRPIAQTGLASNQRIGEALGQGTRSRGDDSRPDSRWGAVWDGGGNMLGQHGNVGNTIWGWGWGDAHQQALSTVVLSGGGAARGGGAAHGGMPEEW
jgi:hypothetical protein